MISTKNFAFNLLALCVFFLFCSCEREEIRPDGEVLRLTQDEAVELIEASMSKQTGGAVYLAEAYAEEVTVEAVLSQLCDTLYNDLFTAEYNGPTVQSDYQVSWSYRMDCNNLDIPQAVAMSATSTGSYSGPKIDCEDTTSANIYAEGLSPMEELLVMGGSYLRSGTQEMSGVNPRMLTSEFEADLTGLTIEKNTFHITSGMASVSLNGTSNTTEFSYVGTVTFLGDGAATLDLNGTIYNIDLN